MKICNRSHVCIKSSNCKHAKPHDDKCGPAMPCYDDPSGMISMCVEIVDGKYSTFETHTCNHCNGHGSTAIETKHDI